MERPTFIDLSAASSRAASSASSARLHGHPSPRIQHFDGDVPPTLSPLDAFAAESRRLAKELEATRIAGEKRMSRLPPALITQSLSQHQANRPACFRTLSSGSPGESIPDLPQIVDQFGSGQSPTVNEPSKRPMSSYPRISAILAASEEDDEEVFSTPREVPDSRPVSYFDIGHVDSPNRLTESPITQTQVNPLPESQPQDAHRLTEFNFIEALLPPNAAFARSKSHTESSDDDYQSSNAGSTFSRARKLSASSGMSFPASPALLSHDRKASNDSDTSLASQKRQRQTYNFSRPLSSMSLTLKADSPSQLQTSRFLERKHSQLSEFSRDLTSFEDDRSVASEGFVTGEASSYTHKKFTLPRGRALDKNNRLSQLFLGLSAPDFKWQEPLFPATPPASAGPDGYFEVSSPASDQANKEIASVLSPTGFTFEFESDKGRLSNEQANRPASARTAPEPSRTSESSLRQPSSSHNTVSTSESPSSRKPSTSQNAASTSESPSSRRPSTSQNAASFDKSKMPTLPPIPGSTVDEKSTKSSSKSAKSESTVRPSTARSVTNYQALSADEHVEKAISLHESGDLKESTYHLRIAAKQNHPTAMLLFALAARHGWGMRANQKEGVAWLRKAVDSAMLEVAEDEDPQSGKPRPDFHEKKSHRAQFALTIYELGVSHLNGWGVEQDKALALRCFEIAGNWGDTDALTEAGFCYAQGVGCKKDLRKAAKFYRTAAEKGVSMVGNSWIYKDKYLEQDDDNNDTSRKSRTKVKDGEQAKKPRDRSRRLSIWNRKKSAPASPVGA